LIGLLPKSADIVCHLPPFDWSSSESKSWRALLCRSCRSPNMEGQLPAMWPLLTSCPHIGHKRVLFHASRRVLCTHYMTSILCVNWVDVREECRRWRMKSAPRDCAVANRSPCLVVCCRGGVVRTRLYLRASHLRLVYVKVIGGFGSSCCVV
jgi:hypothetical protein